MYVSTFVWLFVISGWFTLFGVFFYFDLFRMLWCIVVCVGCCFVIWLLCLFAWYGLFIIVLFNSSFIVLDVWFFECVALLVLICDCLYMFRVLFYCSCSWVVFMVFSCIFDCLRLLDCCWVGCLNWCGYDLIVLFIKFIAIGNCLLFTCGCASLVDFEGCLF